jgi:2-pyrone-4,6-dicarboxylate lactonase
MTAPFTITPGWLDWDPNPSTPTFALPAGTVDAHCHVFGPGAEFPFAPERRYTPCDASQAQLRDLHAFLGIDRCVIVQATCHGADNSAMADALRRRDGKARGIATIRPDVTDAALRELHEAGVRGVRFTFLSRLAERASIADLEAIAARIAPLGWHVVVYFEAADLAELEPVLRGLPLPVVVDHMGRPDVTLPADGPDFDRFLRFAAENDVWVKVSCPERLTVTGPPAYADVVPFARRAVAELPERVLWGTDWPHPNLKGHMPDDGLLVDHVPHIAPTPEARHRLLVDNPMRLYWPEERS